MWSGGTATTVSCAAPSTGAKIPAPSPLAVRTCSWLRSESHTSTPARLSANPTDVPSSPAPTTCTGPTSEDACSFIGDGPDLVQVAAQRCGSVQVDVGDVLPGRVGLDVRHHPYDTWHRPLDLQLARA